MSTDQQVDTDVAAGKPFSTQDADVLAQLFESWQNIAEDESLPALTPLASRLSGADRGFDRSHA